MKQPKTTSLLKRLGTLTSAIAPLAIVAASPESTSSKLLANAQWTAELNKFSNFSSGDAITSEVARLPKSDLDIKDQFVKIKGYVRPNLDPRVAISKVVVDTPLNPSSRQVVYRITLWDGKKEHLQTKDVIVGFSQATTDEVKTPYSFTTTDPTSSPAAVLTPASQATDIKTKFLAITARPQWTFPNSHIIKSVTVAQKLAASTRQVTFRVVVGAPSSTGGDRTANVVVTFAPDWTAELAKISSTYKATSTVTSVAATATSAEGDVKSKFALIEGANPILSSAFSSRVAISKVVVKTPLDANRRVKYTITLWDGINVHTAETKDVTVTFTRLPTNWIAEKAKLSDFTTSSELLSAPTTTAATNVKDTFIALSGYNPPALAAGVTISKVVVKSAVNSNREVIYEVTLSDDTGTATKEITVTYAPTWATEKAKLIDFTTTSELLSAPIAAATTNVKDTFIALGGYIAPDLATGVSISKVVVKSAVNSNREVVYEVTLSDGTSTATKEVTVTYAPTWVTEKAKLADFTTTDDADSLAAQLEKNVATDVKSDFNGITLPSPRSAFALGVTISKVLVKTALNLDREVVYEVTLSDGTSTTTKDVTVTFAIGWVGELAKLNDFVSTDATTSPAAVLAVDDDVDVKEQFKGIANFPNFGFSRGVEIKKVVVKTAFAESSRKTIYSVTIGDSTTDHPTTKAITVTFAPDWAAELAKLSDFETLHAASLPIALAPRDLWQNKADEFKAISDYQVGFAKGVAIKKVVVKTALNQKTRQATYTITLWDSVYEHPTTKDVTVTFGIDWSAELARLQDFTSTDFVDSRAALLEKSKESSAKPTNVKTEFFAITGYEMPNFTNDVEISRVIVKSGLNKSTRQVVYSVFLTDDESEHETAQDVTVTFTHTLATEAKRIADFISSDAMESKAAKLKMDDGNIKTQFQGITNYQDPNLASGITMTKVVVKKPLDKTSRKVVFEVTLEENKPDVDPNPTYKDEVVVTFKPDFTPEIQKLKNYKLISTKGTYSQLAKIETLKIDIKKQFVEESGITFPSLAPGVEIKEVTLKTAVTERIATYNVKLWDTKSETDAFEVRVLFADDLRAGLNALQNFVSTDDTNTSVALLGNSDTDIKDQFYKIANFKIPTFATKVSITKIVVKTPLVLTTRKVVFTITLKQDNSDKSPPKENKVATKDITVTFAPDLDAEANKFKDFSSTDNVESDAAKLEASDENIKATFDKITGYKMPPLGEGVQIKSIIVKEALNKQRQVTFTITLAHNKLEATKDVVVTFGLTSKQEEKGLSTGALVGIVLGSVFGLGIGGFLTFYFLNRKR